MDTLRLSSKEALILRLLVRHGEMYGLQLVKESGGKLKRGTVYVTLARMAEKGYVDSRQVGREDESGPPKRVFQATGRGARVLAALELMTAATAAEYGNA